MRSGSAGEVAGRQSRNSEHMIVSAGRYSVYQGPCLTVLASAASWTRGSSSTCSSVSAARSSSLTSNRSVRSLVRKKEKGSDGLGRPPPSDAAGRALSASQPAHAVTASATGVAAMSYSPTASRAPGSAQNDAAGSTSPAFTAGMAGRPPTPASSAILVWRASSSGLVTQAKLLRSVGTGKATSRRSPTASQPGFGGSVPAPEAPGGAEPNTFSTSGQFFPSSRAWSRSAPLALCPQIVGKRVVASRWIGRSITPTLSDPPAWTALSA